MTKIIIVMGVAGCGKSTIGESLAVRLGYRFIDADNYHSVENKAKMASGTPLTDADRMPWLAALKAEIESLQSRQESVVMACSCLKQSYRDILLDQSTTLVYLKISQSLAEQRLLQRSGHFMKAGMLDSQFATLEEPVDAITVDAALEPEVMVDEIVRQLD